MQSTSINPRFIVTSSQPIVGVDDTAVSPFQITGRVLIKKLYGIVTERLGNHTSGIFFVAGGGFTNLTLEAGAPSLTDFDEGSLLAKTALATSVLTVRQANALQIIEPATSGNFVFSEFVVSANPNNDTYISYGYSTTDDPTSGVIQFYCEWEPLSSDGNVIGL